MIREQLVNQKVKSRSTSGAANNRARSASSVKSKSKSNYKADWRDLVAELKELKPYLMIVGIVIVSFILLGLLFFGYRAAVSSSFFQLKEINVNNTAHTSSEDIKALTRRVVGKSGVWNADIDSIKNEIEKLPWVRSAIVSRVLPDSIRIRVTEREPVATVRLSKDRIVLVDEEANVLAPATSKDKPAPFMLRGWDESVADNANKDNRERIKAYRKFADDLNLLGVANRVREVNLDDVKHVRASVVFNDSVIELRLGDKDFGRRIKYVIDNIEIERGSLDIRCIAYVDVTQGVDKDARLVLGTRTNCSPGATDEQSEQSTSAPRYNEETGRIENGSANKNNTNTKNNKSVEKDKTEKTDKAANQNKKVDSSKKTEQATDKKKNNADKTKNDKKPANSKAETRPRKV